MSKLVNHRTLNGLAVLLLVAVVLGSQISAISNWLKGPGAKEDIPVLDDAGATASGVEATVKAYNGFAFDLYRRYSSGDDNILFSPYSISTALSMTYEGARGETAEEMESVFGFPTNPSERLPSAAKIYNTLNEGAVNTRSTPSTRYGSNETTTSWRNTSLTSPAIMAATPTSWTSCPLRRKAGS